MLVNHDSLIAVINTTSQPTLRATNFNVWTACCWYMLVLMLSLVSIIYHSQPESLGLVIGEPQTEYFIELFVWRKSGKCCAAKVAKCQLKTRISLENMGKHIPNLPCNLSLEMSNFQTQLQLFTMKAEAFTILSKLVSQPIELLGRYHPYNGLFCSCGITPLISYISMLLWFKELPLEDNCGSNMYVFAPNFSTIYIYISVYNVFI